MELIDAVIKRRSIRSYLEEKVSRELISEIIDIARFYPSWKNSQTARFYVVDNTEVKLKIATEGTFPKGNNRIVISECPTLVVLTIKKGISGTDLKGNYLTTKNDEWEIFDSGLAAQNFCLVAYEKGVSSVILGLFYEDIIANICNIPEDEKVSALIPIGYPKTPVVRDGVRKTVEEITKFI